MKLLWSHDSSSGFGGLTQVDLSHFLCLFLIDFFSISSYNIGLIKNYVS